MGWDRHVSVVNGGAREPVQWYNDKMVRSVSLGRLIKLFLRDGKWVQNVGTSWKGAPISALYSV